MAFFPAMDAKVADVSGAFQRGRESSMRNKLMQSQLEQERAEMQRQGETAAREEQARNMLAQYSGASPEEQGAILNQLMAVDPQAAMQAKAFQQQNTLFDDEQRKQDALKKYQDAEFLTTSKNPALALDVIDADGSLRKFLHDQGEINLEDGIDDDEARAIGQWAMQALGPVAGIGPEGRLGGERAEPGIIREMRAVGIDPNSAEGRETWLDLKMREGATDQALDLLKLQLTQHQFDQEKNKAEEAKKTAEQQRGTATFEINKTLDHLAEAAEINRRLASSWLKTGGAGMDQRRLLAGTAVEVSNALGVPRPEAEQMIADFDRLKKLTSELIVQSMGRVSGSGLGAATNDRLSLLNQSMASIGNDTRANELVIADAMESLISSGGIEGLEIADTERRTELAQSLRAERTRAAEEPVIDAPGAAEAAGEIARMGIDQLRRLDLAQLSDDAINAAERRWNELNE